MIVANLHQELITASGKGELNVDLTLQSGAITCLYGDSGVGKTMILRMLAGLEDPKSGSVKYNDESWYNSEASNKLSITKRKVGYVFQDYGLFPNMTVEENIRFASEDKNDALIPYYIRAFGLEALKDRKPSQLSGGQKQRTAIARTLVFKPRVLLLDEPLTAQDKKMSLAVGKEIIKYTEDNQAVTVLVTHDLGAVLQMSTYIYSINDGKVEAEGTVEDVFLKGAKNQRNGIHGVVADVVNREGSGVLLILVNEQLLEIQQSDTSAQLQKGDEVYLELTPDSGSFKLQKL